MENVNDMVDIFLAETYTCPQNRYSTSAALLHAHFSATSLKMIIYYIPGLTGVSMTVEALRKLFSDKRVAGMKFTSTDFFMLQTLKATYSDKLFFDGFDEDLIAGFSVGCDGGIGTTYNFVADKFVNIYELCSRGEFNEALKIQNDVNKIVSVLLKVGVIPGTKEVLKQLGYECGVCRKPFKELTNEEKIIVGNEILPLLWFRKVVYI